MIGNGIDKFSQWKRKRRDKDICGTIDEALALKNASRVQECKKLLEHIEKTALPSDRIIASYELGLLYSQLGYHEQANVKLRLGGFNYKLSPLILCPDFSEYGKANPPNSCVRAFDNCLPSGLLADIRQAFCPSSAFWTEHNYPCPEFFSYNIKIVKGEKYHRRQNDIDIPGNLLYDLINALQPLVNESFPEKNINKCATSVELWCHLRNDSSSGGLLIVDMIYGIYDV